MAASLLLAYAPAAQAAVVGQDYLLSFTALCSDCGAHTIGSPGTATGTIQLHNYVLGSAIQTVNLTGFSYHSVYLGDLVLTSFTDAFGKISSLTETDPYLEFYFLGNGGTNIFYSGAQPASNQTNTWGIGPMVGLADIGTHLVLTEQVPEPATLALAGLALAGLSWTRRKRA
jgi:hypothetical protein